ncbi:hypothetical protein BJV82DRAFT_616158 [Fennellomyces sp. T-0311]|nr:hypothetical protein BJV82DRAFT_616158 [Fennellomyces sp. T-0311]
MTTLFVLHSTMSTRNTISKRSATYMNGRSSAASSSSTTTSDSTSDHSSATSIHSNDCGPTPQSSNVHLALGTRVIVPSLCVIGTLRFLGDTHFKPGVWAGIELDVEGAGKNDGCVQGVRYFACPQHTGLFVLASKVTPLPSGMEFDDEEEKKPVARSCASSGCCSNKTTDKMRQLRKAPASTKSTVPTNTKSTLRRNDKQPLTSKSTLRRSSDATPSRKSVVPQQTKSRSTTTRSELRSTTTTATTRKSTVPQMGKSHSTMTRSELRNSTTTTTRKSSVPQTRKSAVPHTRKSVVPQTTKSTVPKNTMQKSRSTVTRELRKSSVPNRRPAVTRRSSEISSATLVSAPAPRTASRSTTTRRTKHTIHSKTNGEDDHERLRKLLEESRKEHEKLCQELTGKEAAWERVLSSKESYALQVKEAQQEIRRLQATISNLESERQTWLATRTSTDELEQHQQRINRLDKLVQHLQLQQSEKQAEHENAMRHHAAEMAQLRRALAERDSATATLERECEALRKAGMDAIQMYETSTTELKQHHQRQLDQKQAQIAQLTLALEQHQLPQQDDTQHVAVATDQRRRLEEQLQIATAELERERMEKKQKNGEIEKLTEQISRLHRTATTNGQEFNTLQSELSQEVMDKRRIMEEANIMQQKYVKLQNSHDQLLLAKNKLEHELAETKRRASVLDQRVLAAEQSIHNLEKSYVKNDDDRWLMDRLQKQCQTLEAEKEQLQKELDNRRLSSGPISPLSPVSMASFSSLMGRLQEDQTYCEICEVYGHDVMSCTAYLTTAPAGSEELDHGSQTYCLNCDVFGTHKTEECPNSDEMF